MRMWHDKNTQLNGKVVHVIVYLKGNEFLSCGNNSDCSLVHTSKNLEFPFDDFLSEMRVIRNLDSRLKKNVFKKYYSRATASFTATGLYWETRLRHCPGKIALLWKRIHVWHASLQWTSSNRLKNLSDKYWFYKCLPVLSSRWKWLCRNSTINPSNELALPDTFL